MGDMVVASFLVDRPVLPGMVRAILDTLSAQGGVYEPQFVHRSSGAGLQRIARARPAGLYNQVGEGGTQTTFLRVAEGGPQPVLSLSLSRAPRVRPSTVTLEVPLQALATSQEIEQVLGVCKGLYLFLESPWGHVGVGSPPGSPVSGDEPAYLRWANFLGPQVVAHIGPARLLTSMAFMVEILPDGGIMVVTHPSPDLADLPEGRALRHQIEESSGLLEGLEAIGVARPREGGPPGRDVARVRRRSAEQGPPHRSPPPPGTPRRQ